MVERQTARKVRVKDIVNGRWVKKEGMVPSYAVTFYSEKVSRVELVGTVVASFTSENENFRTITIDDSTETVRIKAFKPLESNSKDQSEANRIEKAMKSFDILNKVKTGDLISIVGRLKEYNEEIYVMPELIRKITHKEELVHRLETAEKIAGVKKTGEIISKLREKYQDENNIVEYIKRTYPDIKDYWISLSLNKSEEPGDDRLELRKQIMKIIEVSQDGIKYTELLSKIKGHDTDIEAVINDLLNEGVCYEPMPGIIKKI
ncbi:MAG: hypothetical protein JW716_02370 [Candidatus Aenigmarchaeota archaeon]|nr:hypothetical protein [Candidatus Aenigmarchaeota archaeon]